VFDEDHLIPPYGFGSLEAKGTKLFSYLPRDAPCLGLEGMLARYRQLAPHVTLSGGTSFAPAIQRACEVTVASSPPQYHILLLICDGQVSEECKEDTLAAIQQVALRYANHSAVVGLQPVNEPWDAIPWPVVREFYWRSYRLLRHLAPNWSACQEHQASSYCQNRRQWPERSRHALVRAALEPFDTPTVGQWAV
jgi:hypothetical protein